MSLRDRAESEAGRAGSCASASASLQKGQLVSVLRTRRGHSGHGVGSFIAVFSPARPRSAFPPSGYARSMAIRVVRLGSKRAKGEGLRLGTVRRPPRGVAKADFAERDFYDVWLPQLSPSAALVKRALAAESAQEWRGFVQAYRREMSAPDTARLLDLLAAMSHASAFSVGCYCEDEARCHRSVLRALLKERGAKLV